MRIDSIRTIVIIESYWQQACGAAVVAERGVAEDKDLTGSDNIRRRLSRLQKDLEAIKKGREDAQEQLTDISDTLERLQSGQTKHKQELDEEQKRQDEKRRKTQ